MLDLIINYNQIIILWIIQIFLKKSILEFIHKKNWHSVKNQATFLTKLTDRLVIWIELTLYMIN